MKSKQLVSRWFNAWEAGDFMNLPVSNAFEHHSPFGVISGKGSYEDMVRENQDKFLGYTFLIHDGIYEQDKACVRYTAQQGEDFKLDVSEWYYMEDGLIQKIISYYHIGDIKEERQIETYTN